ncbi:MAG: B12-binding domain-containing radical SAM protein [bacterium]|nr:B12-binding domain-containing radical SAM protein [bacterium]
MKIIFIRPNMQKQKAADALQPLVFALLAGLTPPDIETVLYDERIEDIPFDEPGDLVAMTVETFAARRAYDIAAQYRQRGIPVVMGGFHPSLMPEEALQHADSIVIGDAEQVWRQVLADAERGDLQRSYRTYPMDSPLRISFDRRIFSGKSYPHIELVQWGRGCIHHCDFCAIHALYGTHQFRRPVEDVIAEIESLNAKLLFLVDDNLFVNKQELRRLLEALKSLNVRWSCQVSLEVARDKHLMKLMEQSGCKAAIVGFESLNPANLRQMNKSWNGAGQEYARAIRTFYDRGIMIYGSFVFGYDHDSPDAFDRSLEFALQQKLCMANFNPLTPFPGTPLYTRLQAEKRLIHEPWWLHEGYQYGHAAFHPRKMSAEELTRGCFEARKQFNSYSSIFQRALNVRVNLRSYWHMLLYFVANYINRKAIYTKQGAYLGS